MAEFLSRNFRRARRREARNWYRATPMVCGLVLALIVVPALAVAGSADPPVPSGRHPGGFPVAVIGAGIDYTRSGLAQMLARDGEGEIIGYDFIDDDRRPFAQGTAGSIGDATELIVAEGQAATLVAIRANPRDPASLAKAIGYATRSPAKIIAINDTAGAGIADVIEAASEKFPGWLFIVSSDYVVGDGEPANTLARNDFPNVITTTAAKTDGSYEEIAEDRPGIRGLNQRHWSYEGAADIAVATNVRIGDATRLLAAAPPAIAVARTAALAARLQAVAPNLDAAAMKVRILGLAKPLPGNPDKKTRAGWIAEPWRHFWLE